MRFQKVFSAALLSLLVVAGCSANTKTEQNSNSKGWQQVTEGIEYQEITIGEKNLTIVKIDPTRHELSIQENIGENEKTIKELQEATNAIIAFNGAFFTEDFKPTGLLRSEGKNLHDPVRADILDGIFTITTEQTAALYYKSNLQNYDNIEFAIQNGPTLINDRGDIVANPTDTASASRTAIGIDKNGNIIVILLKQTLLKLDNRATLHELATILKNEQPFNEIGIHSVLNLDGGTSSGIAIQDKYFPEMEKVDHVILVHQR